MKVYRVSVSMVQAVHAQVAPGVRRDRELGDQVHRASRSVVLNVAEGIGVGRGKRRDQHFRIALGSAREVMAVIDLAVATGLLRRGDIAGARDRIDHVCAMLWKLTHGRRPSSAA
jgi:four helix bundle protein